MTFKELFSQFSFAEISPAFLNLWQTNEPIWTSGKEFIRKCKRWRQNHPPITSAWDGVGKPVVR